MNDKSPFKLFYKTPEKSKAQPDSCIVSHNVFWLQGVPFATDQPLAHRAEILTKLCSLYRQINPNVLCLQELQSREAANAVAGELGMECIFRSGGSYPQYGGAVFSRWPMEEIALPSDFTPDRIIIPVKIYPENAPPFHLVNVHLPSSRQRGAQGSQKQRLHEIALAAEQADILLGDFNETPDGHCAKLLKKRGFVDTAEACAAGELFSNLGTYRGDHIWLSKENSSALQGYFIIPKEELELNEGETKYLSDHLPVGCLLISSDEYKEN